MELSTRTPLKICTPHDQLKPISWIMGEWKSISAVVKYPTMKSDVYYNEDLSFTSLGQPFLNYKSITWYTNNGLPKHLESGFLKVNDDGVSVSFLIAQSYGVATIEEGTIKGTSFKTSTSSIGHVKLVKQKVVKIKRTYRLNEKGQLEYVALMETRKTPLTEHVIAVYEKCS